MRTILHTRFLLLLVVVTVVALAGCSDGKSSPTADVPAPLTGSGGLIDFFGHIDALTGTSITVDGRVFVVDRDTHVFDQGAEMRYFDLRVGDLVLVKAKVNVRGDLIAREIRLR
jgi:hypothetical protein